MKGADQTLRHVLRKFVTEAPSPEDVAKAVSDVLLLPWLQKLLVFADHGVVLINLHDFKYVYISPSCESILGIESGKLTDLNALTSIMSPKEFETAVRGTELILSTWAKLKLSPEEALRTRATRNNWITKGDGRIINLLQHNIALLLTPEGFPLLQMNVFTDITSFNNKPGHFITIVKTEPDGSETTLFSQVIDEMAVSDSEKKVLELIRQGLTSAAIASRLGLSAETVKTHRKHLLEKTGTRSTVELLRYGYANGWL